MLVEASLIISEAAADEKPQASVTIIVPADNGSAIICDEVRRIRPAFSDSANLQLFVINDRTEELQRLQDLPCHVQ